MAFMHVLDFRTESKAAAAAFRDEYMRPAMPRIRDLDGCDAALFGLARSDENPDSRTTVRLQVFGDIDQVIDVEKDNWEKFKEEGSLQEWERLDAMTREDARQHLGDERLVELMPLIQELSSQVGELAYDRFDELDYPIAAVDTFPEADSGLGPAGWWIVLHTATVQLDYSLREELDAYEYGMEHTFRNIAEHESPDAAVDELESRIEALEAMRDRVQDGRLYTG